MTNEIKTIEPQTLESSSNIKGTEKIETIYPETIEVPNYDYGNSQNTLDYNIALRNKPRGGGMFPYIIQQSISATTTITITPGFTPSYIEFKAVYNGNPGADCETLFTTSGTSAKGFYNSWAFNGTYVYPQISDFTSTTSCLRLIQYKTNLANPTLDIRARVENITATSFDLNFYEVEYTGYVTIIVKCYP